MKNIDDLKIQEWNKSEVLKIFRELRFNRYIDRFKLNEDSNITEDNEIENQNSKIEFNKENIGEENFKELEKKIKEEEILYFYIETKEDFNSIIKKSIKCISIYIKNENKVYDMMVSDIKVLKDLFENENILKCSYDLKEVYILALEAGIKPKKFYV